MRAVTCAHGELEVVDLPEPEPAKGQLVLQVQRCGICGSDLHARQDPDGLEAVLRELAYDDFMSSGNTVAMGRELAASGRDRPGVGAAARERRWSRSRWCGVGAARCT